MHACSTGYNKDSLIMNALSYLLSAMLNIAFLFPAPDPACQQQHVMPALLSMSHSVLQCVFSAELLD